MKLFFRSDEKKRKPEKQFRNKRIFFQNQCSLKKDSEEVFDFFYFFAEEPSERFELTQKKFPQERKKKNFSAQTKKEQALISFVKEDQSKSFDLAFPSEFF